MNDTTTPRTHMRQSGNGCVTCPRRWSDHTAAERGEGTNDTITPRTAAGRALLTTLTEQWGKPNDRLLREQIIAIEAAAYESGYRDSFSDGRAAAPNEAALDVDRLAELEHLQWAEWASTVLASEPGISTARRERWERLIATPYSSLTEAEKHEDRIWAEKVVHAATASGPPLDPKP